MTYRDDREALERRVAELEADLARAREAISRLEGREGATSASKTRAAPDRVLGVRTELAIVRELDFEIGESGFEAIAEVLRARLPLGQIAQIGRTLTHRWQSHEIRVSHTERGMEIRARANHKPSRNGLLFVGPLLGALVSLPATGILLDVGTGALGLAVAIPIVLVIAFLVLRQLVRRTIEREQATIAGVVEAIATVAQEHRKSRRRIALEDGATREAAEVEAAEAELAEGSEEESARV